jgi:hypothetical protein
MVHVLFIFSSLIFHVRSRRLTTFFTHFFVPHPTPPTTIWSCLASTTTPNTQNPTMSRRSTYSGPTLAQFDADIQASVSAPDSPAVTLNRAARSGDSQTTSKAARAGYARTPQKSPTRGVSHAHTRNTFLDEISTWLPVNAPHPCSSI